MTRARAAAARLSRLEAIPERRRKYYVFFYPHLVSDGFLIFSRLLYFFCSCHNVRRSAVDTSNYADSRGVEHDR